MSNNALAFAVAALLLGAGCASSAPSAAREPAARPAPVASPARAPGETATAVDLDRDGRPERWLLHVDASGGPRLVRTEHDLDGDGRVDRWDEHDPSGAVVRAVYDLDLDGRADTVVRYDGDRVLEREIRIPGLPPAAAAPTP